MSGFGSNSGNQDLMNTPDSVSPHASVKSSDDFTTVNALTNDGQKKGCNRYKQFDRHSDAFPNTQNPCSAEDFVTDEMSGYGGIDFRNDSRSRKRGWRSQYRGRWAGQRGQNGCYYNHPDSGGYPPHHNWHARGGRRKNVSRARNRPDFLGESGESGPAGGDERTFSPTETDLGAQPPFISRRKEKAKLRRRRTRALKAAAKAQAAQAALAALDLHTIVTVDEVADGTSERQQVKPEQKGKRKEMATAADEPECKIIRTEPSGDSTNNTEEAERAECDGSASNPGAEEQRGEFRNLHKQDRLHAAGHTEETSEGSSAAPASTSEEAGQSRRSYSTKQEGSQTQKHNDRRVKHGYIGRTRTGEMITAQRIVFVCSVCKFRSFYRKNMEAHLESKFHKDHFKFLSAHLPAATVGFLQEHFSKKLRKVEDFINQIPNHRATICQLYEDKDLTQDISMEHFMRKAEAAHCLACDVYIPMQHLLIQEHLKSPDHKRNCTAMMVQSKHSGLSTAYTILSERYMRKKLEIYLKDGVVMDGPEVTPDEVWSTGQRALLETSMMTQEAESLCEQVGQAAERERYGKDQGAESLCEQAGQAAEAVGDGKDQGAESLCEQAGQAAERTINGKEQQSEPVCEETVPTVEKIKKKDVHEEPEQYNLTKPLFDLLDEEDDIEGVELGEEEMGEDDI